MFVPSCDVRVKHPWAGTKCYEPLFHDEESQRKFLSLIHRTIAIPTAIDHVIHVSTEDFDKRIKGVITATQYPHGKIIEIAMQNGDKYHLLKRIKVQEHIIQALGLLNAVAPCKDSWQKGRVLMENIDKSTGISEKQWFQLINGAPTKEEPSKETEFSLEDLDKEPPPLD